MASLLDEFNRLISTLNKRGIEYAVCGGWAMTIHGAPRATMDIDLLILSESLDSAWQIAQDLGYWVEGLPSFHNGEIEIRRISKIDAATKALITIDFLLVTPALEGIWQKRKKVEWEKGIIWVVSREGLIELKQSADASKILPILND